MPDILTRTPTKGLSSQAPETAKDLYTAAKGSQNVFYEYGLIRTPYGFTKLGLTTTGLNSGDIVLSVFQWREIDRTSHLTAVTTEKIYDYDNVNDEWDDKTQSGIAYDSNIDNPVSYVECGHDDTNIYIDDNAAKANAYHHVIVCDGGLTNIQRWAGRFEQDFADLTGGGDYHDGTTHRAKQISLSSKNRLLLLSPLEYNSSSKTWVENNQRLRWPTIGKIQTWTGTGSGSVDLYDTGGVNIWAIPLGMDHIIYQTKGIWSINYVGSTTVYDPRPMIPDLGLLAPHGLVSYNNVHYFMGTDYNVHAYYGGYSQEIISEPVHKFLFDDLYEQYESRCWMSMSPRGNFLWVLIASSSGYLVKAYIRNMKTGAWTIRDFSAAYDSSGGLTSLTLAGSASYIIGDTYNEELNSVSLYDDSVGDATERYGDNLMDSSRTLAADYTTGTWGAGGFSYQAVGENFQNDFTVNDMMVSMDPSGTNTMPGYHFFTVESVCADGFKIYGTQHTAAGNEHGIADNSTNVPTDLSFGANDTLGFYSLCANDSPGETYNEAIETIRVSERLIIADSSGFIYQIDETYTDDDGNLMDCRHLTPVIDGGSPHRFKRWGNFNLSVDGSADGAMLFSYRVDYFETSDTGWVDYTIDLTTENKTFNFWPNVSSKRIQCKFSDFSGKTFYVRNFVIGPPQFQGNR